MMASLLAPAPANGAGRMSQLLPTVKCSNCNRPVPLAELGDHICAAPPPVPTLPKPSVTPNQATSLLPQRLQNLVSTPTPPRTPISINPRPASPARSIASSISSQGSNSQRAGSPSVDRPRVETGYNLSTPSSSFPSRSSPLARSEQSRADSYSPVNRARDPYAPSNGSPLREDPPPAPGFLSRGRSASNASNMSSPSTARPSFANARENPPQTPSSYFPTPEPQVETKAGGEAGMAGVGRRGFAAAARAAMFVAPQARGAAVDDQLSPRRTNVPQFLDIDAAIRCEYTRRIQTEIIANVFPFSLRCSDGHTTLVRRLGIFLPLAFP